MPSGGRRRRSAEVDLLYISLPEGGATGGALPMAGVQVGLDAGAAEHVPALGDDAVLLLAVAHATAQQLLLSVHLRTAPGASDQAATSSRSTEGLATPQELPPEKNERLCRWPHSFTQS